MTSVIGRGQLRPHPGEHRPGFGVRRLLLETGLQLEARKLPALLGECRSPLEQVGRLEGMRNARHVDRPALLHVCSHLGGCMLTLLPVGGIDEDVIAVRPVQPDTAVVPGEECRSVGEGNRPANRAVDCDTLAADDENVLPLLVDRGVAQAADRNPGLKGVRREASSELRRAARGADDQRLEAILELVGHQ